MKKFNRTLPAGSVALWLCMAASSHAQLTVNYDFTSANIVTDNGQVSVVKTLGGLSGLTAISGVNARLNLTTGTPGNPMFLGDLYTSLTFGNSGEAQRIAVLLNRPGRDDTNAFGSSLSSLNVTLDESGSTNVWAATTGTGTYQADGRLSVDPGAAGVAFAAGSNGLAALNGTPLASNRVSLLVADYATGGVATLSNWGLSVTGTAASSGTFTPGANAWLGDTGSGDTNTIGAVLSTSGASAGSMELRFAGTTTFSNGITGSAGINKTGSGTVTLAATSTYTGTTTVNAGELSIGSTSTINDTSGISIGSGEFSYNNSTTALTQGITFSGTGGILSGTGTITSAVTITSGNRQTSGTSVTPTSTTATVGMETFNTSITYNQDSIFEWNLNADNGVGLGIRGTDYDAVNTASLGTTGDKAIFRVILNGTDNFDEAFWNTDRVWSNIFTGLDGSTALNIASIFTSAVEYYNSAGSAVNANTTGRVFTITGTSLTWSAVPEPTCALAGLLLTAGLLRRRRM